MTHGPLLSRIQLIVVKSFRVSFFFGECSQRLTLKDFTTTMSWIRDNKGSGVACYSTYTVMNVHWWLVVTRPAVTGASVCNIAVVSITLYSGVEVVNI